MDVMDRFIVNQCIGPSFDGFDYLPAVGTRGGKLLAWNTTAVNNMNVLKDTYAVTGEVHCHDSDPWSITWCMVRKAQRKRSNSWKSCPCAGTTALEHSWSLEILTWSSVRWRRTTRTETVPTCHASETLSARKNSRNAICTASFLPGVTSANDLQCPKSTVPWCQLTEA
jgi:hypothetical protein